MMSKKEVFNKKSFVRLVIISSIICLIPMALGIILYDKLPENLPTSFDFSGKVTRYSHKNQAVFTIPIFMSIITLISGIITYYDPFDKKRTNKNPILLKIAILSVPLISNFIFVLVYFYSVRNINLVNKGILTSIGILFIFIGNYLPKNKQNAMIGIRTPWSLKDEINWNKTNRFGGYMFIISGVLFIILGFLGEKYDFFSKIILGFVIIMLFSPSVYSFLIYKNNPGDN